MTSRPTSAGASTTPAQSGNLPATSDREPSSVAGDRQARLIYVKSHVAIHPTQHPRDNITGLLGLVEVDREVPQAPDSGASTPSSGKEILIVWVPDELFKRLPDEDKRKYERIEGRPQGTPTEEDGFVFVSLPAPKGEKYAFSVPITSIYSILVYSPSRTYYWYGSATFNLLGGVSLPTLYFHDDQTPLATTQNPNDPSSSQWGFPPFLKVFHRHATLLRSRLITPTNNRGGELWLVNPSKADREVHEAGYEEKGQWHGGDQTPPGAAYPPPATPYPTLFSSSATSPRDSLLVSLSNITNMARHTAQNVLNHPLAKPVVPHLPPAFRSLVHAPGEWQSSVPPRTGNSRSTDVATEFEAARLYLARWARVVAEEGERSRRDELAARAGGGDASTEDFTSLGVFSLLPGKRKMSKPTRHPERPITAEEWDDFIATGKDEQFVRQEIFRRGFSDMPNDQGARRRGWEVLLGVVPWSVELGPSGLDRLSQRAERRDEVLRGRREEYERLHQGWREKTKSNETPDNWKEEWHRIDVDCRRTDRTQALYAVLPEVVAAGDEEKEGGGAGADIWSRDDKEEEGGHASLNPHIAELREILMTYHVHAPDLGYVQGMSDLLSPIYCVFDGSAPEAFYGLIGVMKMMESNFLRDQSGMRRQLSTLQQLIALMDPELHAHLERTGSLNLFFCFRWILIAFKREFKFEEVIRLWEVLWTNYYSDNMVLFVALAVLQSHRDVIIRYLSEFDEVLKYANDLTGTIDLDTTLAQAEVLFLSFRDIVSEIDKESSADSELRQRRGSPAASANATASTSASSTAVEQRPTARTVSPEVRELLRCWTPETVSESLI
ncbi:RabGAP/TBC [Cutaneotrichosporon oleaginosum]|uniref:RabGAP/TBC n=1 Tax=Cutaneotrichosporon oleaginosum TaxID=879819 RepID=A0A0J0XCJ7_9TREE|nr:RabGAP/TBC [Cutaneotrichosporon oleaginosum]KLT38803.1 RabGAP/TBC [Cutaneotrichosporon oleaginosum]TXT06215.1 hypothetical protein COLE_05546 [Cutaneotrichosporon oleaginosum]